MQYIADLHIHSPFSRATSKASTLAGLFAWARVKGINLVGTGDFTHPGWFASIRENLLEAEPGFFRLKNDKVPPAFDQAAPEGIEVRFVLTAEISSIYKRHGRVRKVHNVLFAPDFASVERLNRRLAAIGNIESDGRPILGLDSRDLLEIQLTEIPDGFLVPAHIWTPWFSLFGSRSGFDSIEECFGDLTEHIFALETGLSSDPDMNRLVSALDRYTLISNSDCHSPAKLGREVNLFSCDFDFFAMKKALRNPAAGFDGTVEFFPEEGKYHLDGHRKCHISLEPGETRNHRGICPVCGSPLTVGVSHRVMDLADRDRPHYPEGAPGFKSLIPLPEVLGEILGRGPATKGVMAQYQKAVNRFGSEFNLYLKTPIEEINALSPLLGEAVERIRSNRVIRRAGFDGQFGVIRVFAEGERERLSGQASLFNEPQAVKAAKFPKAPAPTTPLSAVSRQTVAVREEHGPNPEQAEAVKCGAAALLVSAGPGTGKTFTLAARLLHLLREGNHAPGEIFAITFTNRAAGEMRERLIARAGDPARDVFVGTFHRFCLHWLQEEEPDLTVIGEEEREIIIKRLFPTASAKERKKIAEHISTSLEEAATGRRVEDRETLGYLDELAERRAIDLDYIIPFYVARLRTEPHFADKVHNRVRVLFVDEFQDVNRAQYDLVTLLCPPAILFAIGDPNQAIYGFRGSDLSFFFELAGRKGTRSLALTKNYRSAPNILETASALIAHNRQRGEATLVPQIRSEGEISFLAAPTAKAEAEQVVKEIERIMGGISSFSMNSGRSGGEQSAHSFRDIAVLYRLGRQATVLAQALSRRGIPFQLVGAPPFYMNKALRGLFYWFMVAGGEATFAQHLALLRETPGIGAATLTLLADNLPLTTDDFFGSALAQSLPDRTKGIISELRQALIRFREEAARQVVPHLLPVYDFFSVDPQSEGGRRFLELAGAFGSLSALVRHLQRNAGATIYDERAEAVSLMTLHGAKGLEFPVVFICGLEKGYIPSLTPGTDEEEERRLFYVGMTRARERLILSASRERPVSPFLAELPAELVTTLEPELPRKRRPQARQLKLF